MRAPAILLLSSIFIPLITAQAAKAVPDGLIVPFTSVLPACASVCGKLFDVQGACTPPNIAQTSSFCFCGDPRLKPMLQGTTGVQSVCTTNPGECTDQADLQKIQNWYAGYCNEQSTSPTTTSSGSNPTGTGSGSGGTTVGPQPVKNQTWFQSHWRWVVMVIVITLGIIIIWVGAVLIRRRYIRKKEREIEMKPPVAWGPHQMQNQTGGYNYGDGVVDANGGRVKEAKTMGAVATPAPARGAKRESKGWLRKERT